MLESWFKHGVLFDGELFRPVDWLQTNLFNGDRLLGLIAFVLFNFALIGFVYYYTSGKLESDFRRLVSFVRELTWRDVWYFVKVLLFRLGHGLKRLIVFSFRLTMKVASFVLMLYFFVLKIALMGAFMAGMSQYKK